jgi:acetoin utilization protein AcuC
MRGVTPPYLIAAEIYRHSSYGPKHPLAIPRVSVALDLIRALGWQAPGQFHESERATPAQLQRFHTSDYIAALQHAEATGEGSLRHAIGHQGNPVFGEVFSRPATSAGGTLLATRLTLGGGVVHHLAGGTHHGRPDRASGFCYSNDAALGLLAWLDAGLDNLFYLDLDAHHGDGVEDAFRDDPRVFTLSLHEAGRWPRTGGVEDQGATHRNLPMPEGANDTEYLWAFHHAVLPLIRARKPQAIMLQCGADALAEDPLARLALSNGVHAMVAAALLAEAPRLVVLGGGGYNPWTVARCWAGVWGALNGHAVPERLPTAAERVLRELVPRLSRNAWREPPEHWFTTLRDPPRPGTVRAEVIRGTPRALRG